MGGIQGLVINDRSHLSHVSRETLVCYDFFVSWRGRNTELLMYIDSENTFHHSDSRPCAQQSPFSAPSKLVFKGPVQSGLWVPEGWTKTETGPPSF